MSNFAPWLQEAEAVSFDVFDTCLFRKVARPVHVFDVMQLASNSPASAITDFKRLRIAAEARARRQLVGAEDVTLAGIYEHLAEIASLRRLFLLDVMRQEIETEIQLCYANPHMLECVKTAVLAGKRVAFISDMYLPADCIRRMLEVSGFPVANCKLFVSSDTGFVKGTGKLFRAAIDALGIPDPSRMLHIGDNKHADCDAATKVGIVGIHYKRLAEFDGLLARRLDVAALDDLGPAAAMTYGLARYHLVTEGPLDADFGCIGYNLIGPVIAGWTRWLNAQVEELAPKAVLLFARDAQLIHKLSLMGLVNFGDAMVSYVYVSRHSLIFGALLSPDDESLRILFRTFKAYEFSEFFSEWTKFLPDADRVVRDLCCDHCGSIVGEKTHRVLSKIICANHQLLLQASKLHRDRIRKYVLRYGSAEGTVLIDIGWNGNMQEAWSRIVKGDIREGAVTGLYLGLFPEALQKIERGHNMRGWLTSPEDFDHVTRAMWSGGVEILEVALSADHGTTLGYSADGEPVLADLDQEPEYRKACRELQSGIVRFLEDASPIVGPSGLATADPSEWSSPFFRLVNRPTLREVELLGAIPHSKQGGRKARAARLASTGNRILDRLGKLFPNWAEPPLWKAGHAVASGRQRGTK